MTWMESIGVFLIVYSPPICVSMAAIGRDPIRLILTLICCFFWTFALGLNGIMYTILKQIKSVDQASLAPLYICIGVIGQEIVRVALVYGFCLSKDKANKEATARNLPIDDLIPSIKISGMLIGIAFMLMQNVFVMINLFNQTIGRATAGFLNLPSNFLLYEALQTMLNSLLQFL
ncbi:hypothetical protein ACOME3_000895 [Neoechinorhynchus agilis]